MHLSRIEVPLADRRVQRLLSNPYALHQALLAAFPDRSEGGTGRVLYRVEPEVRGGIGVVLVQSVVEPNWNSAVSTAALPRAMEPDSKPIELGLRVGQRLRFRLRFNPTVTRDGTRRPLQGEDARRRWLEECLKGERHLSKSGRAIEKPTGGLRLDGAVIVDEGKVTGQRRNRSDAPMTFLSARADGVVTVDDVEKALRAVQEGIGPAKAFGFGLLSLAGV